MLTLGNKIETVKQKIVDFIRHYCAEAGYERVIIGLSGGVDSAAVAYLCVEALGAENVYCIRIPHATSSRESKEHAQLVIDALGARSDTVPISTPTNAMASILNADVEKVRFGNIMARMRMIVLYDLSKVHNALVVGTGNKTETLLGYCTLYGDSAAAFRPIAGLYKTQVFELARYLGVPDVIVDKAPSADLWTGQTDEGELGYSYEKMDATLYSFGQMKDCPKEGEDIVFDEIIERWRKTLFKRQPAPFCEVQSELL